MSPRTTFSEPYSADKVHKVLEPHKKKYSGRWSDTRKVALRGRRREERPQGRHAGSQSSADGGVTNRRLRISQLYENPEVYRPSVETGLDDCSGHAPFSTPPGGLCYPAPCRSLHLKAAYKGAKTRLLWGDGSSKAGLGVVLGVGSAEAQLELGRITGTHGVGWFPCTESSSHLSSHCRNKNGLHFHCNSVQEQRAEHKRDLGDHVMATNRKKHLHLVCGLQLPCLATRDTSRSPPAIDLRLRDLAKELSTF
ncbi:hypothetical protein NQZ68_028106 [Dissostichus eleginoides]|nr:hypothetical protein NQZ68_028106 [Dissostichus eleginoides]